MHWVSSLSKSSSTAVVRWGGALSAMKRKSGPKAHLNRRARGKRIAAQYRESETELPAKSRRFVQLLSLIPHQRRTPSPPKQPLSMILEVLLCIPCYLRMYISPESRIILNQLSPFKSIRAHSCCVHFLCSWNQRNQQHRSSCIKTIFLEPPTHDKTWYQISSNLHHLFCDFSSSLPHVSFLL